MHYRRTGLPVPEGRRRGRSHYAQRTRSRHEDEGRRRMVRDADPTRHHRAFSRRKPQRGNAHTICRADPGKGKADYGRHSAFGQILCERRGDCCVYFICGGTDHAVCHVAVQFLCRVACHCRHTAPGLRLSQGLVRYLRRYRSRTGLPTESRCI